VLRFLYVSNDQDGCAVRQMTPGVLNTVDEKKYSLLPCLSRLLKFALQKGEG